MGSASADTPSGDTDRQYHIGLGPGDVAPWIILVGDPGRARRLSSQFDSIRVERSHREYVTFTGSWRGRDTTLMATGMGCDNTEIAVMELLQCVRHPVLLRVGSSGGLQENQKVGDLVISTGALRLENTSLGFVDPGFPAVAHHEVVLALISAAEDLKVSYHTGITATAPGFYGWQGRRGQILEPRDPDLPARLGRMGVANMEMETSTLFTLATLAGIRAGAVCAIFANRPRGTFIEPDAMEEAEDRAFSVAGQAIDRLSAMDEAAGGGPFHLP